MAYQSTKTFEHVASAAFRQWRADSHCSQVHGYGLTFKFVFGTERLDFRNWVVDFGGLKTLKSQIEDKFDHKLVVASDDPAIKEFKALADAGAAELTVVDRVGCEAFAEMAYWMAHDALVPHNNDAFVVSCECMEHGANSAIYLGPI